MRHYKTINVANYATKLQLFCRISKFLELFISIIKKKSSSRKCKMKIFYDIISINEVKSFDNCNMNQFFVFVLHCHRIIPRWKLIYHQALFANSAIHRNNLFEKFYLILFHKHSMCHLGLLAINQPHAVLDRDRNILNCRQ